MIDQNSCSIFIFWLSHLQDTFMEFSFKGAVQHILKETDILFAQKDGDQLNWNSLSLENNSWEGTA